MSTISKCTEDTGTKQKVQQAGTQQGNKGGAMSKKKEGLIKQKNKTEGRGRAEKEKKTEQSQAMRGWTSESLQKGATHTVDQQPLHSSVHISRGSSKVWRHICCAVHPGAHVLHIRLKR